MNAKGLKIKSLVTFMPKAAILFSLLIATGCTAGSTNFGDFSNDGIWWFGNTNSNTTGADHVLPRDSAVLANGDDIKTAIYNAVQLAKQKRFDEARRLLTSVRELQTPEGEGYQALTCSMALLALRAGDIRTFKRTARQLDLALDEPVNVDPAYVEVISLYRMLAEQNLPVNAPTGIKRLAGQFS